MKKLLLLLFPVAILTACSKKDSGKSPGMTLDTLGSVNLTTRISTDSTGNVTFTATAANAQSYRFDFGDSTVQTVESGKATYKYGKSGSYTVKVIATGPAGQTDSAGAAVTVGVIPGLLWADDFNTAGAPDATKWTYDTAAGGWGNSELEYYTTRSSNVYVSNGTLKIVALKENYMGSPYTSARIKTEGLYSFQYGRIDVMAKLPAKKGTWPAIWMMGDNITSVGWPACGETDIVEQNGSNKNVIYGTIHYPTEKAAYGDGATWPILGANTVYHKYSVIWSATTMKILVDDLVYYTLPNNASLPFNQKFFIVLNVAMGGVFGSTIDPAFTTDQMEIDYVRVYQ
jgi:beta-glucanase (GH16 family)